jgi:NDP-mannose synthase
MTDSTFSNTSVIILAGGKGTRLQPFTAVFPKPLVPLGNRTVLEILLRRLAVCGLTNITICTGHLSELLMAVFGNGAQLGLNISYSHEETPLGTAGPLANIKNLSDPFLVMNGDLLTTLNFTNMLQYHVDNKAAITIGTFSRDVKIDFGVIELDEGGDFFGFREKPTYHFEVSMGVNVISRSILDHIPPGTHLDMPTLVTNVHSKGGKICCYRENCYWLDIGRLDDYGLAQEQFTQNEKMFLGETT